MSFGVFNTFSPKDLYIHTFSSSWQPSKRSSVECLLLPYLIRTWTQPCVMSNWLWVALISCDGPKHELQRAILKLSSCQLLDLADHYDRNIYHSTLTWHLCMVRVAIDGRHAPESNPVCVCKHSEQQNMIRRPIFWRIRWISLLQPVGSDEMIWELLPWTKSCRGSS